ncbi:NADP-dependent oxidoreductase domain-containing protein [Xylogone sp. PMI_703]|nr:NADP-dependent oxidoreductase domain-containing protein [Xylogone sp. PMI_703]
MNLIVNSYRLTRAVPSGSVSVVVQRLHFYRPQSRPIHINLKPPTSSLPFGAEGNLRIAPKEMGPIKNLKLNDGHEIPIIGYGLGTANFKRNSETFDQKIVKAVVMAIKTGYYHLDGAEVYGNEPELGEAIKESGVPREKLYVTTKYFGKKTKDVKESFANSLKDLQLDYVDLYLIHEPFSSKTEEDLQAKWADMEDILASGKAKSIGVSNFTKKHLETILKTAKVVPACNQIEYHPYLQHEDLVDFHKKHGIATAAYAPLTAVLRAAPGPLDEVYSRLATKYNVTPAQIALRWCLDHDVIVLTTSGKEERLKTVLEINDFSLTPEEVAEISRVGNQKHHRGFWANHFDEKDRS